MLTVLAASQQGSSGGFTVAAYYVVGTVIPLAVAVIGAVKFYGRQKSKWKSEGEQHAEATRAMVDNTAAAKANTVAIADLSVKLDGFATSVRTELNGHETRISRLEMQRHAQGDNRGGV